MESKNETAICTLLDKFVIKLKMMIITKVILIALIGILQTFYSCQKNPIKSEPEPGDRNYEWELDTLNMPMNYLSSIWGATTDDVWAIGGGGTESDRLLHYDGTKWSTYTKETIWCSGFTVFGFSADDVWMGGGAGWLEHGAGIWHYDGVEWTQNYVYSIEDTYHSINVIEIWGPRSDDVYACGTIGFYDGTNSSFRGFVLHYDGTEWQEIARADFNSQFLRIRKENDNVYVFSYGINYETSYDDVWEFYRVKDNELQQIYSGKYGIMHGANISVIDKKVYFVIDNDVYQYKNGDFKEFLSIDNDNFFWHVFGRNINDIFIGMEDGIVHYNGTDIEYIYNNSIKEMYIVGQPLILEKDVFYCMSHQDTQWYNMVLHGKLVE